MMTNSDTGDWKIAGAGADNRRTGVSIRFVTRDNPASDDRACRGSYYDKILNIGFNIDYVENEVCRGTRGQPGFWAVKIGYVFSDLIWEAYNDARYGHAIIANTVKTWAELEAEFTAAYDSYCYDGGTSPWLRAWRLIFLESPSLVFDQSEIFAYQKKIPKNQRFPNVRVDRMESRFQSDYDELMRQLPERPAGR